MRDAGQRFNTDYWVCIIKKPYDTGALDVSRKSACSSEVLKQSIPPRSRNEAVPFGMRDPSRLAFLSRKCFVRPLGRNCVSRLVGVKGFALSLRCLSGFESSNWRNEILRIRP